MGKEDKSKLSNIRDCYEQRKVITEIVVESPTRVNLHDDEVVHRYCFLYCYQLFCKPPYRWRGQAFIDIVWLKPMDRRKRNELISTVVPRGLKSCNTIKLPKLDPKVPPFSEYCRLCQERPFWEGWLYISFLQVPTFQEIMGYEKEINPDVTSKLLEME